MPDSSTPGHLSSMARAARSSISPPRSVSRWTFIVVAGAMPSYAAGDMSSTSRGRSEPTLLRREDDASRAAGGDDLPGRGEQAGAEIDAEGDDGVAGLVGGVEEEA